MILCRHIGVKCKHSNELLEPRRQQSLVGAECTTLRVYGSTDVQWEVGGEV